MPRSKPPFRADHVGSLLRPAALKEARTKRERGEIGADDLKAVEDREIENVIRKQEAVGLKSVTDGEFRRASWNYDFLGRLDGVETYVGERKIRFQGQQPKPILLRVIGKLGSYSPHPMIEHFKFVRRAHQGGAEDDDPLAVVAAFPLRPRRRAGEHLSGRWMSSTAISARATARRYAPSPTPAVATSSSTKSTSPICAIRQAARGGRGTAARTPPRCRTSTPA